MDRPEDAQVVRAYCDFLGQYLARGLVNGQMEQVQRRQYAQLLAQCVAFQPNLNDYAQLASTQMKLGEFALAAAVIEEMERRWPDAEQTLLIRLEYAVRQKDSDMVATLVRRTESGEMYLSTQGKRQLRFFTEGEGGNTERTEAI